ncbi:ATP-dependent protease LA-like protein [Vibrio metschnikovii]|uniref:AAA family ATPase n=1 Tax=Vibrio metschnikovii TaxID=28172 RepID=UPI000DFB359E|nr:AAA family ATPase [Vibrio metschnikovii]SUP51984.1 ATP-dependent protease LA-like protein [Vibrio metschnikovii]
MTQDIWRLVTPQYDDFNEPLAQFAQLTAVPFFDTQPRLLQAIERFIHIQGFSRVLLINAPDNSIYRCLIQEHLENTHRVPVVRTETLDMTMLFGQVTAKNGQVIDQTHGLLAQADNGYLIISANLLLANPLCWPMLKAAVLGEPVSPINVSKKSLLQTPINQSYNIKLIVVGDRHQLGDIDFLDSDIHAGLCLFSEMELDIKIENDRMLTYLGYLRWLIQRYDLPLLTAEAIKTVMTAGARYTEDQHYAPLCVMWHRSLLEESAIESQGQTIEQQHVEQAIHQRYYRASYLPERALDDILDGQVIIETQGEHVGQVNGLTVIDVAGHPTSYGEPARISCVIHFGDGDIADVERKVELGGNLHAKGMMIMQAFVSSALHLDVPLPFSASVVFEQSYSEVDGDSASLAELCSLVSALSEYPIDQQIAVTGAVHSQVVESIKNGEFNIWPVSTVDEAIPILMNKPFRGDDQESVISKIAERIEFFEKHIQTPGIVERIKNWFI